MIQFSIIRNHAISHTKPFLINLKGIHSQRNGWDPVTMAWASWHWGKLNHCGWEEGEEEPKGQRLTIPDGPNSTNSWSLMPFLKSNYTSIAYHKLHNTLLCLSPFQWMSSPQSSSPGWHSICHLLCFYKYGNVMYHSQRGKAFQWEMSGRRSPLIRSLPPSSLKVELEFANQSTQIHLHALAHFHWSILARSGCSFAKLLKLGCLQLWTPYTWTPSSLKNTMPCFVNLWLG